MVINRIVLAGAVATALVLTGCAGSSGTGRSDVTRVEGSAIQQASDERSGLDVSDTSWSDTGASSTSSSLSASKSTPSAKDLVKAARDKLNITQDFRESFIHGEKPAKYQKYIVLHDTEGDGDASGVVDYWDGSGEGVAAHFVVNKDGSIVQCVKLDKIAHHAGFGDTGHNEKYEVEDESRDDKVGTVEIGDWAQDYGMNSYSIGIEMVHVGGEGDYPEAQLEAVDDLIAYIDAYYGKESTIIDHKAWRSGNSDTSEEFAGYLANYKDHRTHVEQIVR